jgi:hypothetical protein
VLDAANLGFIVAERKPQPGQRAPPREALVGDLRYGPLD